MAGYFPCKLARTALFSQHVYTSHPHQQFLCRRRLLTLSTGQVRADRRQYAPIHVAEPGPALRHRARPLADAVRTRRQDHAWPIDTDDGRMPAGSCIDLSWSYIRRIMPGRCRVTASFRRADGRALHVRKATRAESEQLAVYRALNLDSAPGGVYKTIV
jgi:hypothetical protein